MLIQTQMKEKGMKILDRRAKMNKTLKIVFSLLLFISFSIPAFAVIGTDEDCYWNESSPKEYPICTEKSILKVTFQVFSGRRDPYFFIDDQKTFEYLKSLISQKQKFYLDSLCPNYTIYQGIKVDLLQKVKGFPKQIIIFNNNFMDVNSEEIFFEPSKSIEKYLLNMGLKRGTINQETYDYIQKVIKREQEGLYIRHKD